jgi:hypothetical protein
MGRRSKGGGEEGIRVGVEVEVTAEVEAGR